MGLSRKLAWWFVALAALVFDMPSSARDSRKAAKHQEQAPDIRTILSIVHVPRGKRIALALRIRAGKTSVVLSDVIRTLPSGKRIMFSRISYVLGKNGVVAVEATAPWWPKHRAAIQEAYEAIAGKAGRGRKAANGKIRVEIKRPGKPVVLAVVDVPAQGRRWSVRFTHGSDQVKHTVGSPGDLKPSTKKPVPAPSSRSAPLVVAGIPVLLGTPRVKLAEMLHKHSLSGKHALSVRHTKCTVSIGSRFSVPAEDVIFVFANDREDTRLCGLDFAAGKFVDAPKTDVLTLWKLVKAVKAMAQAAREATDARDVPYFTLRMRLPGVHKPTDVVLVPPISYNEEDIARRIRGGKDVSEMPGLVQISVRVVKENVDPLKKRAADEK